MELIFLHCILILRNTSFDIRDEKQKSKSVEEKRQKCEFKHNKDSTVYTIW